MVNNRLILLLLILGCLSSCRTQTVKYGSPPFAFKKDDSVNQFPFQVVNAESVFNDSDLSQINRLDFLTSDAVVKLKNGHLIITHQKGKFFEFTGDTTIYINQLLNSTGIDNLRPYEYRPNVDLLFGMNSTEYGGAIMDGRPHDLKLMFISELDNKYYVSRKNQHCFWWQPISRTDSLTRNYQVRLKNIFDETIGQKEVVDHKAVLNFSHYDVMADIFILKVDHPVYSALEIAIFPDEESQYYIPNACKEEFTALEALEIGFYLEFSNNSHGAKEYYQLAISRSGRKVYQEILINYDQRNN